MKGFFMSISDVCIVGVLAIFGPTIGYFIGKQTGGRLSKLNLDEMIKNPTARALGLECIFSAEKYLASEAGEAKFQYAKIKFLSLVPDVLDGIAGAFIQGLHDEVVLRARNTKPN